MSARDSTANVTPVAAELSKVTTSAPSVTSSREKARERVRRHRASQKQAASIEFIRTDASLFLHPDRLSQKAGAPKHQLRRMALKELVDNALDAAAEVTLAAIDDDTFVVADNGPGLDPDRALALFSVTRPMMSTKLIRRPMRGAVGNGLRVATGAAFAGGGSLTVESRGVRQDLSYDRETGETVVIDRQPSDVASGTKITVRFGPALPQDAYATLWGDIAIRLAGVSAKPMLTHPDWYSELAFAELVDATRGTAQDLASLFGVDLCHASGSSIDLAHTNCGERDIDPDGAARALSLDLLKRLAPKPPKLIPLPEGAFSGTYKAVSISAIVGGGTVPAIVQAWASTTPGSRNSVDIQLVVNRTPTIGDLAVYPGGETWLKGCGLDYLDLGKVPKGSYRLTVAVTTPAVLLVNDGKTPDLSPFKAGLSDTIGSVLRRCHRPKTRGISIKDAAFEIMEDAYLKASANGTLPANARQIMYAARPYILEQTGQGKLNDAYFTQTLLPAFMEENPNLTSDWDVVYDARGHLIEPHTGHSLPLGTLHVRQYLQRQPRHGEVGLISTAAGLHPTVGPGDRYGAVLFIEKEGFEPLLRAARIAERFDIALMSTKGMSVIAARALVDRLSGNGVRILVAHDLDLAGIRIFGTLGSDSSRYQFSNTPDIRRLGLTLEQAQAMDLQSERQEVQGDQSRIIDGLAAHGATHDERMFIAGGERVELNAMPSDQFVSWIEDGLQRHGVRKVVPAAEIIERRARQIVGIQRLAGDVAELERMAQDYAARVDLPADLSEQVRRALEVNPAVPWEDALADVLQRRGDAL